MIKDESVTQATSGSAKQVVGWQPALLISRKKALLRSLLDFKASFALGMVLLAMASAAHADYETPESRTKPRKTVEIGTGLYVTGSANDTAVFQQAIDDVNEAGGGRVIVPAGEYRLMRVVLKSEVHLTFQSGVTIRSPKGATGNIFELKGKSGIKNVSIVGPKDRVLVDFTAEDPDTRVRAFGVGDCQNFRIAKVTVNDNRTRFSSIILGWEGVRDGKPMHGRDGLIEKFTANNAHYGYGAIQAHSGENVIFRNITSVGGVAVRLETGLDPLNYSGIGGLFNILVENVLSKNGQAAMMMQPHTMDHGDIVGRNINADGSEFALYISKPFVSKRRSKDAALTEGSFKSITIDGVKAIYREGPIVTRFVHLKYYPEELHSKISRADNGPEPGYRGPSIAASAVMQADTTNVTITNVEAIGFVYRPDILTPKDTFQGNLKSLFGAASKKTRGQQKADGNRRGKNGTRRGSKFQKHQTVPN